MPRSLIGLGANLADRTATLQRAVELLAAEARVSCVALSGNHQTRPVGGPPNQGAYLNAALVVETSLPAEGLHQVLQRIENELGRTRGQRWAARTIDLDLLLYGDAIVNTHELAVPHPRMTFRRFVLEPAVEVAADMVHPLSGSTLAEMLERLDAGADYVAILGMPEIQKSDLAQTVARDRGGACLALGVADWQRAAARDPSGHASDGPIQFLDRAAGLLANCAAGANGPVTSDFYFDEPVAYARATLDEQDYQHVFRQWSARCESVVPPKLLVVLDTWQAAAALRAGTGGESADLAAGERLRRELLELSLRAGKGPFCTPAGPASNRNFKKSPRPWPPYNRIRVARHAPPARNRHKSSMSTRPLDTTPRVIVAADQLRQYLAAARGRGATIGVVPTMGALHEGHLSLVDACRRECDVTVVTIFVNPTQFGPGEDFTRYPRDLDADVKLLARRGADVVFAPEGELMYPPEHATYVEVAGPALGLEGDFRPGHFRGVATIVLKLFHLVAPDRAYFGRKDYQQSLVVRRMTADLDLPVKITVCPIVREADGLAMSSRNVYLSAGERRRALSLSQSLQLARQLVAAGTRDVPTIVAAMQDRLDEAELQVDYVAVCDADSLAPLARVDANAVALVAARVGTTRLIDNEPLD